MNKLYIPLLATVLVGGSATAQHSAPVRKAATDFMRHAPREAHFGGNRDVIWSNDFSNAADWEAGTIEGASDDTWVIGTTGPTGAFASQVGTILSTTAANGFALFDSDLLCSGNQEATLTLVNPVDLSSYSGVLFQFEQNYKRFYDNVWVDWSTNGTEWNAVQVNADFDHGGTAQATTNPQLTVVNLSAAAGSTTVYVRFRFESTPASANPLTGAAFPASLVGCAYSWQVDDVAFVTMPDYEVQMNYAYTSTTGLGEEYGRIPRAQLPAAMNLGAEVYNLGVSPLGDAGVQVEVKDASGTVVPELSSTIDLSTIASGDTVVADANLNFPAGFATGVYSAAFSIVGDNMPMDFDTTNNKKLRNFEITDGIYSVDAIGNHPEGEEQLLQYGTATWTDNAEVYYMNMYYINTPTYATHVTVQLAVSTVAGAEARIEAMLFDTTSIIQLPASISQPLQGMTSESHTITEADITAGFVTLALEQPVQLQPGAYFAGVKLSGSGTVASTNNTDPEVYILDDNTVPQPIWTSALFLPVDFNDDGTEGRHSYTNGNAFAIRLTLTPNVSVRENGELTGISIFPNPTNGIFQISSDRAETLFVEIADLAGKSVRTAKLSSMATVDLSDVASGVYTVTVSSATERTVQRVTVK